MSDPGDKACARCGAMVPYVYGEGECDACHQIGAEELEQLRRCLAPEPAPDRTDFDRELETLINRCSAENASDTPDFILARYLSGCLDAFHAAVRAREAWFGRDGAGALPQVGAMGHGHD